MAKATLRALDRYNNAKLELDVHPDDTQLQEKLAHARDVLIADMKSVLLPLLTVKEDALAALKAEGVVPIRANDIDFDFEAAGVDSSYAAELFSELVELGGEYQASIKDLFSGFTNTRLNDGTSASSATSVLVDQKEVSNKALSLRSDPTALTVHLQKATPAAAAHALLDLAVVDRPLVTRMMREWPLARVSELTIGLLASERTGLLSFIPARRAAELVRTQFDYDSRAGKKDEGYDHSNTSAALLLVALIESHEGDDSVGKRRIIHILASVSVNTAQKIADFNYSKREFHSDESKSAQEELKSAINLYSQDVRDFISERRERRAEKEVLHAGQAGEGAERRTAVEATASTVDLDAPVNLDDLEL